MLTFLRSFEHITEPLKSRGIEVVRVRQSRLRRIKVSLYRLSVYKSGVYAFLINCRAVKAISALSLMADAREIVNE